MIYKVVGVNVYKAVCFQTVSKKINVPYLS